MVFDGEMMPFCGGTYRVRGRVETFIDEKTGYMKSMKTPAVILDGVFCRSRYSNHRMFCPRSIFSWWREIWLERVSAEAQPQAGEPTNAHSARGLTREEFRNRIFSAPVGAKSGPRNQPQPPAVPAGTALGRSSS
jgi:hypothetical protein